MCVVKFPFNRNGEHEIENGKDKKDLSNNLILMHLWLYQVQNERNNGARERYGVRVAGRKRRAHALSSTQQLQSEQNSLERTYGADMFYIRSRQGSGHTRLMETTQAEATMQTYCNLSCRPSEEWTEQ